VELAYLKGEKKFLLKRTQSLNKSERARELIIEVARQVVIEMETEEARELIIEVARQVVIEVETEEARELIIEVARQVVIEVETEEVIEDDQKERDKTDLTELKVANKGVREQEKI